MRTIFTLHISLFLTLFFLNASAQGTGPKGKISGKVIDSATRQPVDYATVSIYKQGVASPFNGASTDPKGNFLLDNIPDGDYRITADFLGYRRSTIEHIGPGSAALTIVISSVQRQLKGVTITASAPVVENKIDKLVYNAANDLTSQGGVAIDVLKKVPQVTVDIDGNVELQGNSNIRFLINGKPSSIFGASLADALQSIPASQIKSIEVITSPGAKYDAAGTGGIINIILKDSKVQGINGNINLSAGTRRENGSVNVSARKGNFGINGYFSGNAQLNSKTLNTNNRISTDSVNNKTALFQDGYGNFKRNGYQTGLNIEWNISPKDDFTAAFGYNHFTNQSTNHTDQQQSQFNAGNTLLSQIHSVRNSSSNFTGNSVDVSANYKRTFKKEDQELDIQYNASFGKNQFNSFQQTDYLNVDSASSGIRNDNPGRDHQTNISIDYTQPVTKSFTIETGAKGVFESIDNNVVTDSLKGNAFVPNAGQTYGFVYKRNIYAYYLSATFSLFNKFLDGKAGLRDEYTTTNADFAGVSIPSYNTFAPSAVLSHKLDETQSIKLSYTYRIQRPDYGNLNPFLNISDPHNISTGNPNLKPEIGNNFELGYSKSFAKGSNINFAAFYRHNTDDIQSFTTFYPVLAVNGTVYNDVSLTQSYNIGSEDNLGVNIYGSVPVTKSLSLRTNMFFANRTTKNPGSPQVSGFGYRINLNATYDFGHDLAAEIFGNYRSSQRGIQGTSPAFYFYNLAIRKQFLDKKASIGITAANPFGEYVSLRSTTFGPGFSQTSLRQVPIRSFGITLSYKFGKLEFKKDKNRGEEQDNTPAVPEGR